MKNNSQLSTLNSQLFRTFVPEISITNEESIDNRVDFGTVVEFLQLLQPTAEID